MSSFRLAARLARRETRRRLGRTFLAALLVAVPVAGMAVAATLMRTNHQTPLDKWHDSWGDADLIGNTGLSGSPADLTQPTLASLLPAGSSQLTYRSEYSRVLRTVDGRRRSAEVTDLPMTDPMAAPMFQIMTGRAPSAAGEVFLTRALARALHATVGDRVVLARPAETEWRVVGIGERSSWWGSDLVVLGPATPFRWRDATTAPALETTLVDLPANVTRAQLQALSKVQQGVAFAPGAAPSDLPGAALDIGSDDGTTGVAWSWVIGAVVLMVVGIIIAAAFAAGARRQLTTLGQLAANGASPRVLRRVLFLQGTWTGLAGVIVGLVLAAITLAVGAPHVDRIFQHDVGPYVIRATDLIPIAILGVAAATIAALVPAASTARIPVQAALAGRRPLRAVPAWLPLTGVAVGGVGLALLGLAVLGASGSNGGNIWVITAIIGGVAVLLGACAIAPGYVSLLEPAARRLRGASRLAARSLARQRTRTGAVVSAICATCALAIAGAALVLAIQAKDANQPVWIRSDEIQLQARQQLIGDPGQPVAPPVAVAVPDGFVNATQAAVHGAQVHELTAAAAPTTTAYASWTIDDFVPDPSTDPDDAMAMRGPQGDGALIVDDGVASLYDLPTAAREALTDDGLVVLGWGAASGRAQLSLMTEPVEAPQGEVQRAPDVLLPPMAARVVGADRLALGSLPRIWLTASRARSLGLQPIAGAVAIVRAPSDLTREERDAVDDGLEDHRDAALDEVGAGDAMTNLDSNMAHPSVKINPHLLESVLAAGAFLLSLFVVGVSLALAAAETREERDVLVVVGSSPPTLRRTSGHKAWLLTVLGALLAIPVGFLPVSVFIIATPDDLPLVFPWRIALLLVAVVPALAAACTVLGSGLALRFRPVRVSTMAFD